MSPLQIYQAMMQKDMHSQWLGITLIDISTGGCQLQMTVRAEMTNGFGVAHGGISYSFADSALAFASNSHGQHAVSIETSINHLAPIHVGDVLIATATQDHQSRSIALYRVEVINQSGKLVALFKGMVFRKDQTWQLA
jgi:acyl-CoA thioesterase